MNLLQDGENFFDLRKCVRKENQARAAVAKRQHDGGGADPFIFVVSLEAVAA